MKYKTSKKYIIAFLTSFACNLAYANQQTSIDVMVEKASTDDKKCGIDENFIKAKAILILRKYGIKNTENTNPFMHITSSNLYFEKPHGCFNATTVKIILNSIQDLQAYNLNSNIKSRSPINQTYYCNRTMMISGPEDSIPNQVSESLDKLISQCLVEIDY